MGSLSNIFSFILLKVVCIVFHKHSILSIDGESELFIAARIKPYGLVVNRDGATRHSVDLRYILHLQFLTSRNAHTRV